MADELINRDGEFPVEEVDEGNEPDQFWENIGGQKKYETIADFMNYARLFRCSNDKGFFSVSEKTIDFCQVHWSPSRWP